jgi:hypothetical protein
MMYHWFRATNKINYAVMAIYVVFVHEMLNGGIDLPRTISLTGRSGRGTGIDNLLEKINRMVKTACPGQTDEARIFAVCLFLNACLPIRRNAERMFGFEPGDDDTPNLKSDDIESLVAKFEEELGDSWEQLTDERDATPFVGEEEGEMPWEKVSRMAETRVRDDDADEPAWETHVKLHSKVVLDACRHACPPDANIDLDSEVAVEVMPDVFFTDEQLRVYDRRKFVDMTEDDGPLYIVRDRAHGPGLRFDKEAGEVVVEYYNWLIYRDTDPDDWETPHPGQEAGTPKILYSKFSELIGFAKWVG